MSALCLLHKTKETLYNFGVFLIATKYIALCKYR